MQQQQLSAGIVWKTKNKINWTRSHRTIVMICKVPITGHICHPYIVSIDKYKFIMDCDPCSNYFYLFVLACMYSTLHMICFSCSLVCSLACVTYFGFVFNMNIDSGIIFRGTNNLAIKSTKEPYANHV